MELQLLEWDKVTCKWRENSNSGNRIPDPRSFWGRKDWALSFRKAGAFLKMENNLVWFSQTVTSTLKLNWLLGLPFLNRGLKIWLPFFFTLLRRPGTVKYDPGSKFFSYKNKKTSINTPFRYISHTHSHSCHLFILRCGQMPPSWWGAQTAQSDCPWAFSTKARTRLSYWTELETVRLDSWTGIHIGDTVTCALDWWRSHFRRANNCKVGVNSSLWNTWWLSSM